MKTTIINIIRVLIACMFFYAAFSKLFAYSKFGIEIRKSPVLIQYSSVLTMLVPLIEIAIGMLLLSRFSKYIFIGFYCSWFILSIFTIYIIYLLNSELSIPCSCGGILGNLPWNIHIAFNIFFMILSAIGVMLRGRFLSLERGR